MLPCSDPAPSPGSAQIMTSTPNVRQCRGLPTGNPLECPKCKGPMRVIVLIEDPQVIRRILEHLGLWVLEPPERSPPVEGASWPRHARLPLTYHPVPDIA